MFNSYASGGYANANNNLHINAVSGMLVKNHPKSIFVIAKADSTLFDPTDPRYKFPDYETYIKTEHHYKEDYSYKAKRDKEISCIVLQALIIGEGLFMCEIVKKEDFFEEVKEDNILYADWFPTDNPNKKRCGNCDVVHLIAQYPFGETNWCPNCGAKMRKEDN